MTAVAVEVPAYPSISCFGTSFVVFDLPLDVQRVIDFLHSLRPIEFNGYRLHPLSARSVPPLLHEDYEQKVKDCVRHVAQTLVNGWGHE